MIGQALAYLAVGMASVGDASALVADAHQHEWIEIANISDDPTFLDVAYSGTGEIEGKVYPVVLVRYLRGETTESAMTVDVRIAIDCRANAMSGLEVSFTTAAHEGTGMRVSKKETLSTPFTSLYRQNEARAAALFKHACGPDWSMKAPG